MDEKKLLEQLRRDAESITPPESLQPDAIEAMLRQSAASQHSDKKHRFFRSAIHYGSMAAIFVLGLTVLWQSERIAKLPSKLSDSPQLQDASISEDVSDTMTAQNMDPVKSTANETSQTELPTAARSQSTSAELLPESLQYADSYEQIYDVLHNAFGSDGGYAVDTLEFSSDAGVMARTEVDIASDEISSAAYGATSSVTDYSGTNLQEFGVDEGDIVKTDGTWIYILRSDLSFSIVRANDGAPELISTTSLDLSGLSESSIHELYLDGNTLSVIADGRQTLLESDSDELYRTSTISTTVLSTWDITDRSQPVLVGTLNQEGYYADSRKTGNYIYLFTGYRPSVADTYEESTITPRINGEQISAQDFYLPELPATQNYLVIASVDVTNPSAAVNRKVLVSGASNFYVSQAHIYITNETYHTDDAITEITKFRYLDGQITGVAAGSVPGRLNNSFSMNEYNGNLRVVSTYYDEEWNEWNSLYVLDETLHQLSSIEDLAKGETIRSARFFGDTGYFVTFRQTDPLFSVDLSDPANPVILGELKVSGFSSYLHFYGENRLLGIGYEADEATGQTTGLKLSMFDISDPSNVTEQSRVVIPGITWCPSIEDYKSILVDPEKNLIGFYCDKRYFVYSYDETAGFTRQLLSDFYSDDFVPEDTANASESVSDSAAYSVPSSVNYDTMRGLYIGDTLYLAGDGFVISYDINQGFAKQNLLLL